MGVYTIEVKELLQLGFHFKLDTYPIFNEDYRSYLNQKIINHFYFREIGAETPDRFNFYLERKMREIMPLYNQLYQSTLIEYDPLITHYLETEQKENRYKIGNRKQKENSNLSYKNDERYRGKVF